MRRCLGSASLFLCLSGCLFVAEATRSAPEPLERVPKSISQEHDDLGLEPDLKMPFVLEVFDEANDGETLSVHGKVISNTYWNPQVVWLRLSSLKKGEVVGVTSSPLSELRFGSSAEEGELTSPDDELAFAMSVPAKEMTDYQLQLLWGAEAAELNKTATPFSAEQPKASAQSSVEPPPSRPAKLSKPESQASEAKDSPAAVLGNIVIDKIKQECAEPPCPIVFRVAAALQNRGRTVLNRVSLGVGYVWQPAGDTLDLSSQIPQNEEKVVLSDLGLQPGGSKPLRLLLDRAVPDKTEKGEFRPVLRVTSAEG